MFKSVRFKRCYKLITIVCLTIGLIAPAHSFAGIDSDVQQNMDRIGKNDGETQMAELKGPYADPAQQEVAFGLRSFFHAPWRSYMDTWDASRYLDVLGINFNVEQGEAEATAQVLEEAGIRSARVEVGWGELDFDDDTQFRDWNYKSLMMKVAALRKHHIRPLILLNFNSGMPSPSREWTVKLTKPATAGDREIYIDDTSKIRVKYTGLNRVARHTMFPVITGVDAATGKCTLSAPLPKDLPAGDLFLVQLKYQPFSGLEFSDGTPNPAAQETIDGWMRYIKTVTSTLKDMLETEGQADAGFDLEVYNEYTFGYHFMDINYYYEPKLSFSKPISYTQSDGVTKDGPEIILPLTADYVKNPENRLPGVNVISGFSNQRPWDNGTEMWLNQDGFSKHYYTGYSPDESPIVPGNTDDKKLYIDALGKLDGKRNPDNYDHSVAGSYLVPAHMSAFPERHFYFYQSESAVRDIQPFPGPWTHHFRYANPGNGKVPQVWMSETNYARMLFARELIDKLGISAKDEKLVSLMHYIGTKTTLRNYIFFGHKGYHTINLYAAKSEDTGFTVIPEAFYSELKKNNYVLTDSVKQLAGPQLRAVANVTNLIKTGKKIDTPRALKVDRIVEYKPRLVFEGDGTPEHPDRYNRDDLAVLPYQLDAGKFAIGYYVVTRNMTHSYDTTKDVLDPDRYAMPMQSFDITFSNICGERASVYAYDPIEDTKHPVQIVDSDASHITVKVDSVDYPRFLIVEEASEGPLIENVVLEKTVEGAKASFVPSVDGTVQISWGPYPVRGGGSFKEERYTNSKPRTLVSEAEISSVNYFKTLPAEPGFWRWTGSVVPNYSENYTFVVSTDQMNTIRVWVEDSLVVEGNGKVSGSIPLEAGKSYRIRAEYTNEYANPHTMILYWFSDSQPKELVAPDASGTNQITRKVRAGKKETVLLPGMNAGDGIKLELSDGNVTTRFPQWSYDLKGVLHETTK
ncbi:PA14 domain-containing protein [Paenibacillus hamazuiensis]|uniref:PA14 domain-containing protein n=1 Tax=Paenibacillus hamazuiensis TaxID=2936508 RepID=UPI00200DCE5C|nr:PA14 domain-containing protein [Paenibacillus hamazuiensis]